MMSRSHLRAAGIVLVVLLAFPRSGSANIIDVIWGMSGPQVFGFVVLHCKIYFDGTKPSCKEIDGLLKGKDVFLNFEPKEFTAGKLRVAVETIYFFSTGKNSENRDEYRPFRINMVAGEPMLEISSGKIKRFGFYHGLFGVSADRLLVKGASDFWKFGFKFRPIGITVATNPEIDFGFNVRLYPDGFGRDQFGFGSAPNGDRPREWLYGGFFGLAW
jgi:hypothetical protein